MLRINLLPRYIADNARKKKVVALYGVAIAAVIAGFVMWLSALKTNLAQAQDLRATADGLREKYEGIGTRITSLEGTIKDIAAKEKFVSDAQVYNDAWPKMYEEFRDRTSSNILLKSLELDATTHKTLNITGFAKDEKTVVQWWMYLRNNGDKFESVFFNLPEHAFGGAEATQAGYGGFGAPGARNMRPASFGGAGGGARSSMMSLNRHGREDTGDNKGGSAMGGSGMAMGGGGGGAASRRPGSSADVGEDMVEGRPGISFTATAVLITALAGGAPPPVWGAAAGAAGGPGGMGATGASLFGGGGGSGFGGPGAGGHGFGGPGGGAAAGAPAAPAHSAHGDLGAAPD